jgi:uncharacterized protein
MAGLRNQPLVMVTGASSGIGREIARLMAARGYRTILIARRRALLEALADELGEKARSLPVVMDLGRTDPEPIVARLIEEHGVPDVLFNNAGYGRYRRFVDQSPQEHRRLYEVNYFAMAAMTRAVLPSMLHRRRGHIISTGSMTSKIGAWGHGAYAGAKAAVVRLTQSLAAEHAGSGVHFSYVTPGLVSTEFFDDPTWAAVAPQLMRRAVSARRVARGAVSLLDRPRLEAVVPAQYRLFDWIRAISLPLAHWLTARHSRPSLQLPVNDDGACAVAEPAANARPAEAQSQSGD